MFIDKVKPRQHK